MEKELRTSPALVGVLIQNTLIYNVIDDEGEFESTGLSIINFLKNNRNTFVSKIFESQSYNGIKYIMDDCMVFNEFYDCKMQNLENFLMMRNLILNEFEFVYIYDMSNDLLLINDNGFLALDYNDNLTVRKYINKLKRGE